MALIFICTSFSGYFSRRLIRQRFLRQRILRQRINHQRINRLWRKLIHVDRQRTEVRRILLLAGHQRHHGVTDGDGRGDQRRHVVTRLRKPPRPEAVRASARLVKPVASFAAPKFSGFISDRHVVQIFPGLGSIFRQFMTFKKNDRFLFLTFYSCCFETEIKVWWLLKNLLR